MQLYLLMEESNFYPVAKYGKCSCITCRKIMKPNDLRELEEISSRLKEYEEEVVS